MAQERSPSSGPDLTQGVTLAEFLDGKLAGHVGDQEVLLVHSATGIFAVAAYCSHYHGPLAEGLVVGDSITVPLASRLFRSSQRRSRSGTGHKLSRLLAGRATKRPGLRS
jgi:hypothetical protein